MVLVECKNKKCLFSASLIPNLDNPTDFCCEILFHLVEGTETFLLNGKIQKSSFFEIEANSEAERKQKLICLRKEFGENNTKVFENIPGTNPIVEWELTPDIVMEITTCFGKMNNCEDQWTEIIDADHTLNPSSNRNSSSNINEVWNRFVSNRLYFYNSGMSNQEINEIAIEWTIEEIDEMNDDSIELCSKLGDIANIGKDKKSEKDKISKKDKKLKKDKKSKKK